VLRFAFGVAEAGFFPGIAVLAAIAIIVFVRPARVSAGYLLIRMASAPKRPEH
jgi:hypothetical protein